MRKHFRSLMFGALTFGGLVFGLNPAWAQESDVLPVFWQPGYWTGPTVVAPSYYAYPTTTYYPSTTYVYPYSAYYPNSSSYYAPGYYNYYWATPYGYTRYWGSPYANYHWTWRY